MFCAADSLFTDMKPGERLFFLVVVVLGRVRGVNTFELIFNNSVMIVIVMISGKSLKFVV